MLLVLLPLLLPTVLWGLVKGGTRRQPFSYRPRIGRGSRSRSKQTHGVGELLATRKPEKLHGGGEARAAAEPTERHSVRWSSAGFIAPEPAATSPTAAASKADFVLG